MNELLAQFFSIATSMWRRRTQALIVSWLVCMAGWGFVATLPDTFHTSARVYVDTKGILRPLLQGLAVDSDISAEVELMERTLLTRPNLAKVARMTDLDLTVATPAEMEALLTRLERMIAVRRAGPSLFSISYTDVNAQMAHDVVQALLTIFVENNLGQNRQDMDSARRFIEEQLDEYEQKLEEAEARLAQFKQDNLDILSGQAGYRGRLEAAQARLAQSAAELRDARLRRNALRKELRDIPQFFPANENTGTNFGPPSDIIVRLLEQEKALEDLMSRFTENHPDVLRTKRRIEALRQQHQAELSAIPEIPASGGAGPSETALTGLPNPLYERVQINLINETTSIASLEDQVRVAQTVLDELLAKAVQVPLVEAELTKLNRDYDVLKTKHGEFLSRREAERISRARELEAESVQFRIVEPPQVPATPSGPNRMLLLALTLVLGIGSGCAFVILLFLSSDTISTVTQLREAFAVPVLGIVATQVSPEDRNWNIAKTAMFSVALLSLIGVFSGLAYLEVQVGMGNLVKQSWLSDVPIRW